MAENNLVSANSFPADIEFKLSNHKPKILDAIVEIRESKRRPDSMIFQEIRLRTLIKMQFKILYLN